MIIENIIQLAGCVFSWPPLLSDLTQTPGIDQLKQRATQQNIEA
jgi:hypothetical protein